MTKQTPMEYAKEFSFSGIAHLLGFGVAASALAVTMEKNLTFPMKQTIISNILFKLASIQFFPVLLCLPALL